VPLALPALARAAKLGKRAGRVGFDWPDADGVRAKIDEELREIDETLHDAASRGRRAEEVGDLLFAMANWSRHLGIDPEEALRLANAKFQRRFESMEKLARARGLTLGSLDAAAWDALWNEVKSTG
jgi:ATP diphosphatase